MRLLLILLLSGIALAASSQHVTVSEDAAVQQLMEQYVEQSKAVETMRGWRIQIITTDDRRKMEAARSKFVAMHPGMYMEWDHIVPYYKVKVGAYREKLDLQSFLVELRSDFPSALPIQDEVRKTELVY
jgi:hypothetical protein